MTERPTCPLCGGVKMGPIYWIDDAPKDTKICRRGRVCFSGDDLDGVYGCDGTRSPLHGVTITRSDGQTARET